MTTGMDEAWHGLGRSHGRPVATGVMRGTPEDFVVSELPAFVPDGEGEHLLVRVRKRLWNTMDVARCLADALGVQRRSVTWAGLKDRHAVTEQWFGVHAPGVDLVLPDPPAGITWLEVTRHGRKLRIGALRGNRFDLVLRQVRGSRAALHARLLAIARAGVPNYFGPQRFGWGGGNLAGAERLFAGRRESDRGRRGLYLSAARSLLFNRVLSARVTDGTWNRALPGDLMTFSGSHSLFTADAATAADARLEWLDLHPTGPLPGRGGKHPVGDPAKLEETVLGACPGYLRGLEAAGLRAERRALRLPVAQLHWREEEPGTWRIGFRLPPGSYATSVLRELGDFETPPAREAGDQ